MVKRLTMILAGLFLTIGFALAQSQVSGVVTDDKGDPVIGAAVRVAGTKTGTVTDVDGRFTISAPANARLDISYIGMLPKTVKAGQNIKVVLTPDNQVLDDVMVIAYGKTKKSAFTGSAIDVKAEDISAHITSNATNALVGKVAGLRMSSSSGEPGSSPAIRLRGVGSVNASSEPLYIVDGAPYEGSIANINPNDIESISVQKDASASAIYGARGANGVVIVTTKRGRSGRDAVVSVDAKWGSNARLVPRYDVISDPAKYYETHFLAMYNSKFYHGATADEAYDFATQNLYNGKNGGLGYQVYTVPKGENLIGRDFKLNPNATLGYSDGKYYYTPDNWYDETFHNSFRQEYNVNVTGSTGKLNYFASAGYLNDGGIVNHSGYQRYTARTNVDYQAKKWLKLITNAGFTHVDRQSPAFDVDQWASSGNLFYITNSIGPIYPLYVRNADGSLMQEAGRRIYDANQTGFSRPSIVGNAVRDNEYDRKQAYRDIFSGQWAAVVTPIEGLDLEANISATAMNERANNLSSKFGSGMSEDGQAYVRHRRWFTVNQRFTATYDKTFGDHSINLLAGYEQYKYKFQDFSGVNDHLFNPFVGELGNAKGKSKMQLDSQADHYMTEGFLGRAMYNYQGKYFANASIRRDASSKFAPGHRWGTFGSIGLGWQINKEDFMQDLTWVDLLKLKVSYGAVGNDNLTLNWYPYADQYVTSYNETTKAYSITMDSKGNDNLTWETHKDWNIGVDFAFLKNRISGTVEYFHQTTIDLLWPKSVPLSSGLAVSSYYANIGNVVNNGLEISLEGTPVKTANFEWSVNANASFVHNEITKLDPTIDAGGLKTGSRIYKVGGSVYQAYLYKYAGVNDKGQATWYREAYMDKDGKEVKKGDAAADHTETVTTTDISKATKYDCGTTLPTMYGGFGTSLRAYGFDLSAQFSYQLGGKIYDGAYQALMHNGLAAGNAMHKDLLNAWSETNKNTNIPRLSRAAGDDAGFKSQSPQDRFLTSSNYLCLNNLTLGYTLPGTLVRKAAMSSMRVYVSGENLFLLTKRKGLDPRFSSGGTGTMTSGAGLATGGYSAMRSIIAGISLTF